MTQEVSATELVALEASGIITREEARQVLSSLFAVSGVTLKADNN